MGVRFITAGVLFVAVVAGCSVGQADGPVEPLGTGDVVPDFAARTLDGSEWQSGAYRGGPLILNFWSTTCEPCIREIPLLNEAASDHAVDGLVVIGINYAEQPDRIESFLNGLESSIDYGVVLDPDGVIGRGLFGVVVLPTTFFIDRDGVVLYRRIGEVRDVHFEEGWSRIK